MKAVKDRRVQGVYFETLKNGDISYFINYYNQEKKKILKKIGRKSQGWTISEVEKERQRILHKINNVKIIPSKKLGRIEHQSIRFSEVFEKYINYEISMRTKITTFTGYRSTYNSKIGKHIGNILIDKLTKNDVEKIHQTYVKDTPPKTLTNITSIIRLTYKYAQANGYFNGEEKDYPTNDITRYELNNQRERYFEKEEIKKILNYFKNENDTTSYIFCILALTTGARLGSLTDLQIKDLNLEERTIRFYTDKSKSDKVYYGTIHNQYFEEIKQYLNSIKQTEGEKTYVFHNTLKGKKVKIRRTIQPILNKFFNANVPKNDIVNKAVIHTFRHTFGSQLVLAKVPIYEIQKLMNHSDIKQTIRYSKANDKLLHASVNTLEF